MKVELGNKNGCALTFDGRVKCWGQPDNGVVGLGSTTIGGPDQSVASIAFIDFGTEVATDISVGAEHACAVFASGKLACWGNDSSGTGRLGLGHTVATIIGDNELPKDAGFITLGADLAQSVSAGADSTCVVLT
jgi:hypothetical protein